MKNIFFELEVIRSSKLIRKGEHVVVGYAMTSDLDSDKTIITPEAIEMARDDLLKYSTVLFNHDTEKPIGKVVNTKIDTKGLLVEVVISKEEKEIWNKIKEGIINKFSIKGRASDFEEVDGRNGEKILKINKLELYEVSLVSVPANVEARTISWYVAKSLNDMPKKYLKCVKEGGEVRTLTGPRDKKPKLKADEYIHVCIAPDGGRYWGEVKRKETKKELQGVKSTSGSFETDIEEVMKAMKTGDIISALKKALKKKTTVEMSKILQDLLDKLSASYPYPKKMEKAKNNLISELKELTKKLSEDDKKVVQDAINALSKGKYGYQGYYGYLPGYGYYYKPYKYPAKQATEEFDFADESANRPIFQLNSYGEIDLKDDNTFKKQVLKKGKWYHWDAESGVLDITAEKIAQIVKNFKNKILDNVTIPLTHSKNPAMNTGEVTKLIQTEDGLDAVCEIKDESIVKKIKKGLIKSISASIDPNYLDKKTGKFVGTVLLHAALVHEPYIKGMKGFVQLSEEFKDRPVLVLEDEAITPFQNFLILKDLIEKIAQKLELLTEIDETKNMEKQNITLEIEIPEELKTDIEKSAYTKCVGKKVKEGMSFKEAAKFCSKEVKKDISEETSEETSEEETSEKEAPEKKAEKESTEKEAPEKETSKEEDSKEEVEESEEKSEEESEKSAQEEKVELADAEGVFDKYLKAGKIVPAQKKAIMALLTSKGAIELGDKSVDVRTALINFLENQPKIIDFEEKGTETPPEEKKVPVKDTEMPSDVKEFYTKKMDLSEEAAKEAWEDAKEKQKAERKESTIF